MVYLLIKGWRSDKVSNPVSLVHAIRCHAGIALGEAKELLDRFAADGLVEVGLPTVDARRELLVELQAIGAVAEEVG